MWSLELAELDVTVVQGFSHENTYFFFRLS